MTRANQGADDAAANDPLASATHGGSQTYRITIPEIDLSASCKEGESVLAAMVRHGIKRIPSGCHGGGCGVCKIKIDAGQYKAGKMSLSAISREEMDKGYALACKTFAKEDLEIAVVGAMRKSWKLTH